MAELEQQRQRASDGWRCKVATDDQMTELRFLALKVERDLTQGEYQDLIDEACKDPAIKSKLEVFRLKRTKEKEFLDFLQKNSFKLGMMVPTRAQFREAIDFLRDSVPAWATETSPEEFAKLILARNPDRFLKEVSGVIHVGANTGQERDTYKNFGLRVIWIEPIPEVFQRLRKNLAEYSGQLAFEYLVTDQDNSEYTFHIANNDGASSSILDFNMHKDVWPKVAYERAITLRSTTLASLIQKERINAIDYQALILDTQGSELLVLKGADEILSGFRFVKIEVPDFESYKGCCQLRDIEQFLKPRGFREFAREKIAERTAGGNYYDLVYKKGA